MLKARCSRRGCRRPSRRMRSPRPAPRLRAARIRLLDLTETNPTAIGLSYPADMLAPLASADGRRYAAGSARACRGPRSRGARVRANRRHASMPDQVVLTASTSEAYALLFKLLCNPGDEVLVPQPSYPLFESLTRSMPCARGRTGWIRTAHWSIDRESVRARADRSHARHSGRQPEQSDRDRCCGGTTANGSCRSRAERGVAIIADEVFADYRLRRAARRSVTRRRGARADVRARRAVEVGGTAAGQARLDRRSAVRPMPSNRRSNG